MHLERDGVGRVGQAAVFLALEEFAADDVSVVAKAVGEVFVAGVEPDAGEVLIAETRWAFFAGGEQEERGEQTLHGRGAVLSDDDVAQGRRRAAGRGDRARRSRPARALAAAGGARRDGGKCRASFAAGGFGCAGRARSSWGARRGATAAGSANH